MRNFSFKKLRFNQRGITLIALVITIIVLLILAGVTIATLTGDNGILTRATEAQEETEKATAREKVEIEVLGSYGRDGNLDYDLLEDNLNNIEGIQNVPSPITKESFPIEAIVDGYKVTIEDNGDVTVGDITPPSEEPGNPDEDGIFQETSTINGEGPAANNPTIPAGFRPMETETSSWGDGTSAPSAEDVANGLVITDAPEGEVGNEFVWVPVENFNEFTREHFGTEAQKWWSGTFVTNGLSANNMYEPIADGIKDSTEVEKMYKSVNDYDGFYVGRYEAGTSSETPRTENSEITDSVVVKKGANVYNYIGFADTDDMEDETGGAVEVARRMYNKEKGDSVTSTLIYGVQWDAIMRWMKDESNLTGGKYVEDSTGMGWYSDNYQGENGNPNYITGKDLDDGDNVVKNIYDLAGNVWEWTMESYRTTERVSQGGNYSLSGSLYPASYRTYGLPSSNDSNLSFRVTLYL